jgi:hypothetical protein
LHSTDARSIAAVELFVPSTMCQSDEDLKGARYTNELTVRDKPLTQTSETGKPWGQHYLLVLPHSIPAQRSPGVGLPQNCLRQTTDNVTQSQDNSGSWFNEIGAVCLTRLPSSPTQHLDENGAFRQAALVVIILPQSFIPT